MVPEARNSIHSCSKQRSWAIIAQMNALLLSSLCVSIIAAPSKTTSNPLGFLYDLPDGWSVAATQGSYQVLRRTGQTENEIYVIGGSIEFDAKSSWDKELQEQDVTMMKQLGPWTQSGEVQSFEAKGGKGMYMLFTGSNLGVDFHGQVWSLVSEKKRFGILAIFPSEQSEQRYAEFYGIAKSLRPDPDRKISANNAHAKTWSQMLAGYRLVRSTATNSGSLNGSAGDAGEKSFVFMADGTFRFASRQMTFISAGEFSSSSEKNDEAIGSWSIQSDGKKAFLILKPIGKPTERLELAQSGGYILLNGRPFFRVKP